MGRVEQLDRALARLDLKRKALKKKLDQANATHRVLSERRRAIFRSAARVQLRAEEGLPPAPVRKKKAKVVAPARPGGRGRKPRFPGLCGACMRRHLGEQGGPRHDAALCAKTQAHLKAEGKPADVKG